MIKRTLAVLVTSASIVIAVGGKSIAQISSKVSLVATEVSSCNFARTDTSDGSRPIQINLKVSDAYNYGEVYGQILFDFRRNGKSQSPQSWFGGFRKALIDSGLFSEDREYILTMAAFAHASDGAGGNKRTEIGKQVLYHFKGGTGGKVELLTSQIQAGDRRVISSVENEGIFTLSPRLEVNIDTNTVEIEFEYYRSKQTKIEIGLLGQIAKSITSFLGVGSILAAPQQIAASAAIEAITKPIQDINKVLSDHFEPIDTLKKIKSVGFLRGSAVSMNNAVSYSAETEESSRTITYEVRAYAAVITSIISTSLDGECRYPKFSDDPNSILRAAIITPGSVSIEQFYKNDTVRRTFLSQLGRQSSRGDLIEVCSTLKEDVRRMFGGFDGYAIIWAVLASREANFADKTLARECLTTTERNMIYNRLKLPKLFGET